MSLFYKVFGYPSEKLVPIESFVIKKMLGRAMCGKYMLGKSIVHFQFFTSGETPEQWFKDASRVADDYKEAIESGWVEFALSNRRFVESKYDRTGYRSLLTPVPDLSVWTDCGNLTELYKSLI